MCLLTNCAEQCEACNRANQFPTCDELPDYAVPLDKWKVSTKHYGTTE